MCKLNRKIDNLGWFVNYTFYERGLPILIILVATWPNSFHRCT